MPFTRIWSLSGEASRIFRLVSPLIRSPVMISSLMIRSVTAISEAGVALSAPRVDRTVFGRLPAWRTVLKES